jgi:hypothetical protein
MYDLDMKEKIAEARILKNAFQQRERLKEKEKDAEANTKIRQKNIKKSFKRSEKRMREILKLRKDFTAENYGKLRENKEEK